jgi:hypothetical protein
MELMLIRTGANTVVPNADPLPPATEMTADTTATCAAVVTRAVAALTAGVTICPRAAMRKVHAISDGIEVPQTVGTMKQAAACRA